jgi:GntR family phosphonate transport system transcriptional regulator
MSRAAAVEKREPRWRQVEMALFERIQRGDYRTAGRLPAENDIAAAFKVNRNTVRQALAALVERGLVLKRKGGGSYLVPGVIDYTLGERTRFSANLLLQNREPGHLVLEARELPADDRVAAALHIAADAPVCLVGIVGQAEGIPVSIGQHYFPADRFPGFHDRYRDMMSITKVLKSFGVADYLRKVTRIIAALPRQIDAELLKQGRYAPVLLVEGVDVDLEDRPIGFHETRFSGERVQFVLSAPP